MLKTCLFLQKSFEKTEREGWRFLLCSTYERERKWPFLWLYHLALSFLLGSLVIYVHEHRDYPFTYPYALGSQGYMLASCLSNLSHMLRRSRLFH